MDATDARLLDRIARSESIADACAYLLEDALTGSKIDHAIVVIKADDSLEAIGYGPDDSRLTKRVRPECVPGSALDKSLTSGLARDLPDLGFDSPVLVRFDIGSVDGAGAVILAGEPVRKVLQNVRDIFGTYGSILGRIYTADRQGERAAKLDRQRDLLLSILNGLPDPVLMTDARNNILLANDRAEHLFSSAPEDSGGRRRAVQINNLFFSSFLTRAAIEDNTVNAASREISLVDPSDGSDVVAEVLSASLPGSMVPAEGTKLSILRDITDLKKALTELGREFDRSRAAEHRARQEGERLSAMLENVGDPILVTDDKANIILMNRDAERLFNIAGTPGPAASRRHLIQSNDMKVTSIISDFVLEAAHRRVERIELRDPEREQAYPVEIVSRKILNARGEPTAIVTILHDLTQAAENERLAGELKLLNSNLEDRIHEATHELEERANQLELQREQLAEASRTKSRFLASMSHELRTPINALIGYTAIMREGIYGDLTDEQDTALEKVTAAAQHLLALINDILDLSKIEAGRMTVHLEDVRLEDIVDEVSETIQPLIIEKSLEYNLDLDLPLPTLYTDAVKVRQILLNLLSNAVKFTDEGGVTLRAVSAEYDTLVRVAVADTGIGLKPEVMEHIFEDFRQVDQTSTREHSGTGLGLSITKKLLILLGGTISVKSTYGKGSEFTIELPVRTEEAEWDEAAPAVAMNADRSTTN